MINSFITLIILLLIIGVLITVVFYVLDAIPVPQPFNKILKLVAAVLVCLVVVLLLLQMVGVNTGVDMPKLN